MSLSLAALYALDTLFYASLIFLIVSGLNIIYGVLRIVNLAHATLFALGAYTAAWITSTYIVKVFGDSLIALIALPLLTAAIVTVIASLALVMPILAYAHGKGDAFQLIVTFGLLLVFEELFQIIWGRAPLAANQAYFALGFMDLIDRKYPVYKIMVITFTGFLAVILWYMIYRSRFGLVFRAVAMDPEMSSALGVNIGRVVVMAIILASVLAGLGGALYLPVASIAPGVSLEFLIIAFVGLVIGGLGSFAGSLIGAFVVSFFRTFSIIFIPELELVVLFAVAALVLLVKPEGIGGGKGW
ncbi:MAG: branched-chain amino acid ABC transporter permease [Thermoprotei archaeon]|nr:branched-chain amino acid ABC transporter permease [Thermoprotei archaeon]